MVKKAALEFAIEEVILTFIGGLLIAFSLNILSNAGFVTQIQWTSFGTGVLGIWLGLLVFTIPLLRKVEDLM